MKKTERTRAKFYVEKKGRFVHDSLIFMLLALLFRVTGCWGLWNERYFAVTQLLLPALSALLFILCLRFMGERTLWLSALPVLLGALSFVLRALSFETLLYTVLSICAAAGCALAYTLTAFGFIRTKWLTPPLFLLPLVFHLAVVDVAALRNSAQPVLFAEGMQELSVLCTLMAMFFASLAFKRRKSLEEAGLPKIKDPVVIVSKPREEKPGKDGDAPAAAAPAVSAPAAPAFPDAEKPADSAPAEAPEKSVEQVPSDSGAEK